MGVEADPSVDVAITKEEVIYWNEVDPPEIEELMMSTVPYPFHNEMLKVIADSSYQCLCPTIVVAN